MTDDVNRHHSHCITDTQWHDDTPKVLKSLIAKDKWQRHYEICVCLQGDCWEMIEIWGKKETLESECTSLIFKISVQNTFQPMCHKNE